MAGRVPAERVHEMSKRNKEGGRNVPRLFHYTVAENVTGIIRDGCIWQATAGVLPGERPVVWLSIAPHWEGSASKMVGFTDGTIVRTTRISEMAMYTIPARIEVDQTQLDLVTWREFKRASGIDGRMAQGLERVAKKVFMSDPYEYRCSYKSIPSSAFVSIEYWEDWKWYPWPPPEFGAVPLRVDKAA
jgi:hypothetical protein